MAFEPGYGHYEIKGLVRMFRDRIAATADDTGSTNVTAGGGIGWAAILPRAYLRKWTSSSKDWLAKASAVTALPTKPT